MGVAQVAVASPFAEFGGRTARTDGRNGKNERNGPDEMRGREDGGSAKTDQIRGRAARARRYRKLLKQLGARLVYALTPR